MWDSKNYEAHGRRESESKLVTHSIEDPYYSKPELVISILELDLIPVTCF